VPADVREARSGLPVIDQAVRTLYARGHLHNHARLWLASYLVHLRGVHWRAGADWLAGQLFDGDLASNHLSWQWVAGTGSHRPYLFNAENVARHAPPAWHSPGTVLDTGYDTLLAWAQGEPPPARSPAGGRGRAALLSAPPADLGLVPPQPAAVAGLPLRLVHPWHLDDADAPPGGRVLAVWPSDGPRPWPGAPSAGAAWASACRPWPAPAGGARARPSPRPWRPAPSPCATTRTCRRPCAGWPPARAGPVPRARAAAAVVLGLVAPRHPRPARRGRAAAARAGAAAPAQAALPLWTPTA
jgi:hypothetical protein